MSLLSVRDLRVAFGPATVLSGVSFDLDAGETLAVLGESGSGKSVTAMAVMGILDSPPARVTGGEIRYRDEDLLAMPERDRRRVRGREIAMVFQDALSALNPAVLIADEPTTALDVTVQAQILDLLAELRRERNMALLLITHDLGVVAQVADRIAVMHAGRIVEQAEVHTLFRAPSHPYTAALLRSGT